MPKQPESEAAPKVETKKSELDRLLEGFDAYDLFVGAIAVFDGNLITSKMALIMTIKELKDVLDSTPERLRGVVDSFHVGRGPNLPVSDTADNIYWRLGFFGHRVSWIYAQAGGSFIGEEYMMDSADRKAFLAEKGFTSEELDWLKGLGLMLSIKRGD